MEAIDLAHNVVVVAEASLNSVASLLNLYILGNSSVANTFLVVPCSFNTKTLSCLQKNNQIK